MRTSRLLVVATLLLLGPAVSQAFAVSVKDLIALSHEGVGDAVLVALIETDGSRFTLKADDIRQLKADGLSDAVIVAMIKTSRPPRDNAQPLQVAAPAPEPSYAPPPAPAPVVVHQTVVQKVAAPSRQEYVPVYVPVYVAVPTRPVEVKNEEPVYWGFGGQRRPDAWKEPVKTDPIIKK